jgi:hypothetical protein
MTNLAYRFCWSYAGCTLCSVVAYGHDALRAHQDDQFRKDIFSRRSFVGVVRTIAEWTVRLVRVKRELQSRQELSI